MFVLKSKYETLRCRIAQLSHELIIERELRVGRNTVAEFCASPKPKMNYSISTFDRDYNAIGDSIEYMNDGSQVRVFDGEELKLIVNNIGAVTVSPIKSKSK
jgi:hypothetical protein